MKKKLIIIPTYNEKENIEALIGKIFDNCADAEILVVDDSSPDGTGSIVENMAQHNRNVAVLRREYPRGVGYADMAGFTTALQRRDVDYVILMDGDFSHDPSYIPVFLKTIENCDVVIGSRFTEGGSDSERGILRRAVSKLANFFIRRYLGLSIKDCSSGYRCFRRHALESLDFEILRSESPSILEKMLYLFSMQKKIIKEIPIDFKNRRAGKTKLGLLKLLKVFFDIVFFRIKIFFKYRRGYMKEIRDFALRLALGLNILGFILFLRGRDHYIFFTFIGSAVLVAGLVCPFILIPLKKGLDCFIKALGRTISFVTMLLAFYLVFTPVAFILRLMRKDLLERAIDRKTQSYWNEREVKEASLESYERMG